LLAGLLAVCRAMAPGEDWSWFRAVVGHLRRQGVRRRPKHPRLRDSAELLEAGLALMEKAEEEGTPLRRAAAYRDGLMQATLAARPLRRRNLGMVELGRHLVRSGAGWRLVFAGHETKTGAPLELPWPGRLDAPLERYLERHRPVLLGGRASDRLWIGQRGRPLDGRQIHKRVAAVTRRLFGRPINPHLFRDCFATSVAIRDPGHIRVAAILLGHSQRTNEAHYNQARALEAGRLYQQGLVALRRRIAPEAASPCEGRVARAAGAGTGRGSRR
jgi:integrase